MSALIVLATCLGAVLGMRFRVLVLVPATGVTSSFAFGAIIIGGDGITAAVFAALLAAIFLQFGYISVIVARSRLASRNAAALATISRPAWSSE